MRKALSPAGRRVWKTEFRGPGSGAQELLFRGRAGTQAWASAQAWSSEFLALASGLAVLWIQAWPQALGLAGPVRLEGRSLGGDLLERHLDGFQDDRGGLRESGQAGHPGCLGD